MVCMLLVSSLGRTADSYHDIQDLSLFLFWGQTVLIRILLQCLCGLWPAVMHGHRTCDAYSSAVRTKQSSGFIIIDFLRRSNAAFRNEEIRAASSCTQDAFVKTNSFCTKCNRVNRLCSTLLIVRDVNKEN